MPRTAFLLVALLFAVPAKAQPAEPASHERPSASRYVVLSGGVVAGAPFGRVLIGQDRALSDRVSIGLNARFVVAAGPLDGIGGDAVGETGVSLRSEARVTRRTSLALSAGYGVVAVLGPFLGDRTFTDSGFTLPLEAEAAVHLSERWAATAALTRSVTLKNFRSESGSVAPSDRTDLDYWGLSVGVRLGGW
jgi:hypothetical protein